jgi:hypothetical protein
MHTSESILCTSTKGLVTEKQVSEDPWEVSDMVVAAVASLSSDTADGNSESHSLAASKYEKAGNELKRRVSFTDPTAPHKVLYPGYDSAWDAPLCWSLFIVAYAVRFYRLAVPASVVFDELYVLTDGILLKHASLWHKFRSR